VPVSFGFFDPEEENAEADSDPQTQERLVDHCYNSLHGELGEKDMPSPSSKCPSFIRKAKKLVYRWFCIREQKRSLNPAH